MNFRASIDIGSNSVLLLVAKLNGENLDVVENHSNVTSLGRDLDTNGYFHKESMIDTYNVLKEYKNICDKYSITSHKIIATATEASRVASNSREFFTNVKKELGINVKLITGEAEAFFSSIGIMFDKKIVGSDVVVMDIGGASTELIKMNTFNRSIKYSFSMPVGAVRMMDWQRDGVLDKNLNKVIEEYEVELMNMRTKKLFCVAGTMTSVGNIYLGNESFIEDQVNTLEFETINLSKMLTRFKDFTAEELLQKYPFLGKRSKTIYPGLILADKITSILNSKSVYISTFGLRYGTLLTGLVEEKYEFGK